MVDVNGEVRREIIKAKVNESLQIAVELHQEWFGKETPQPAALAELANMVHNQSLFGNNTSFAANNQQRKTK